MGTVLHELGADYDTGGARQFAQFSQLGGGVDAVREDRQSEATFWLRAWNRIGLMLGHGT